MTLLGLDAIRAAFTTGAPPMLALSIDWLIRPRPHWHAGHSGWASPPMIRPLLKNHPD
ncbi:hypothetical protein [Mesorhizobium intechi]|uniref:hypothetical protein n=1 Tax=Mesorhizobium intechi TaxID=537601 RepID=UPI00142F1F3F|nr:hypothetical protein [Mesorhizobium intechi]